MVCLLGNVASRPFAPHRKMRGFFVGFAVHRQLPRGGRSLAPTSRRARERGNPLVTWFRHSRESGHLHVARFPFSVIPAKAGIYTLPGFPFPSFPRKRESIRHRDRVDSRFRGNDGVSGGIERAVESGKCVAEVVREPGSPLSVVRGPSRNRASPDRCESGPLLVASSPISVIPAKAGIHSSPRAGGFPLSRE